MKEDRMYNRLDFGVCQTSGKVSYDKKGAVSARNKRWHEDHIELRVYQCPDCNWWHLTKSWAKHKKIRHKL